MKKQLIIAITLVSLGLLLITTSITSAQTQASNEFTVPLGEPGKKGKLKAQINFGSISVKGTARKDILVKYTAPNNEEQDKKTSTKDGMRRIGGGGMDLEVSVSGNTVKVGSDSWNNKLNLEIEIPSNMDLEVKTYNDGDLMVTNVQGELELTNYNGEIIRIFQVVLGHIRDYGTNDGHPHSV